MLAAPWFVEAFTAEYLEVYSHRDEASARTEAKGALNLLRHDGGKGRLLDLAAGAGRHALAFRMLGCDTTCLDLSSDLTRRCAAQGLRTVRGDMRRIPFADGTFGAVASLFSSFGYFEDETEHQATLDEIARVLAPGGSVLLDLMDPDTTAVNLEHQSCEVVQGKTIEVERAITDDGLRVEKQVRVLRSGSKPRVWHESVRLFTRDDIAALATRARLRVEAVYGDFNGCPHESGETRQLVVMRKPVAA
ncbi:MAG: class I SAM-dependent methyltransferase [Planctomycetota bacterium]|jgi:SAM-dependent methyltransferase